MSPRCSSEGRSGIHVGPTGVRLLGRIVMTEKPYISQVHIKRCQRLADELIPWITDAARPHGYAIAVHGSLRRDIDLVAAPWTDEAVDAQVLVDLIVHVVKARNGGVAMLLDNDRPMPCERPHGRLCWSIHLGGGPYIDLSVMPRIIKEKKPEPEDRGYNSQ